MAFILMKNDYRFSRLLDYYLFSFLGPFDQGTQLSFCLGNGIDNHGSLLDQTRSGLIISPFLQFIHQFCPRQLFEFQRFILHI